jgi:hypothetical protein
VCSISRSRLDYRVSSAAVTSALAENDVGLSLYGFMIR